jgi:hypothetical protein
MTEKKRLTEKSHVPTQDAIRSFIGDDAWRRLTRFEEMLQLRYDLNREMKFPFGKQYGWGFRYSNKKSLLMYVFFEEGGLCCTISINDQGATQVEAMLGDLMPKTQNLWKSRYPCGDFGGWIHFPLEADDELPDMIRLIEIKAKPKKSSVKASTLVAQR